MGSGSDSTFLRPCATAGKSAQWSSTQTFRHCLGIDPNGRSAFHLDDIPCRLPLADAVPLTGAAPMDRHAGLPLAFCRALDVCRLPHNGRGATTVAQQPWHDASDARRRIPPGAHPPWSTSSLKHVPPWNTSLLGTRPSPEHVPHRSTSLPGARSSLERIPSGHRIPKSTTSSRRRPPVPAPWRTLYSVSATAARCRSHISAKSGCSAIPLSTGMQILPSACIRVFQERSSPPAMSSSA